MKNTVPKLVDAMRPTMPKLAKWAGVSVWVARLWQQGTYQPKPKDRARLVKAVRTHAKQLLALAEQVEREGAVQRRGK